MTKTTVRDNVSPTMDAEIWISSAKRRKIDFYWKGTDEFIIGFNPDYVKKEDVVILLETVKRKA